MQEVPELRQRDSKTFLTDEGTFKTVVKPEPIHYQTADGEWKETNVEPDTTGDEITFPHQSNTIKIDPEPWAGKLKLEGDGYEIIVTIVPIYESTQDQTNELLTANYNEGVDEATVSQAIHDGADWTYRATGNQIKLQSELTNKQAVADSYTWSINYSGVTPKESEIKHKRKEQQYDYSGNEDPDITTESQSEHPHHIAFVTDDGEEVWRMSEPVWENPSGEEWRTPLLVEIEKSGRISGRFSRPANKWVNDALEEGTLILDPTFDSGFTSVADGGTQTHTTPETDIEISNAKVRWQGVDVQKSTTSTNRNRSWGSFGFYESNTDYEKLPSFSEDKIYYFDNPLWQNQGAAPFSDISSWSLSADVTGYPQYPTGSPDNTETVYGGQHNYGWDDAFTWTLSINSSSFSEITLSTDSNGDIMSYEYENDLGAVPENDPITFQADIDQYLGTDTADSGARLHWQIELGRTAIETNNYTASTEDPTATINGTDVNGPTSLSDGSNSSYYDTTAFQSGSNTIHHSINASNEAKFEFEYDWVYTTPDPPTNLSVSGPTL